MKSDSLHVNRALLFLLAPAIVLRIYDISAKNLWFDEAWSWYESQRPFAEMIAENRTEFHPPLFHVLLKLWTMLFGQSVLALRFPSLIASVLMIGLTYLLAKRIMSERAAVIGSVLLAFSPHQLYYAQEARMYALVAVFSLAAALYQQIGQLKVELDWLKKSWTAQLISSER